MNTYDKVTDPELLASLSFDTNFQSPDNFEVVKDPDILNSLKDSFSIEIDSTLDQSLRNLVSAEPEDPKTWADWISPLLEIDS